RRGARAARRGARLLRPRAALEGLSHHPVRGPVRARRGHGDRSLRRSRSVTAAAPAVAVPRVLVWRHGRTEWNAEGRFQGQLDPPLDERGRRQAAQAAPYLAAGLTPEDTVVVSSDLVRAAETARSLTGLLGGPLRLDERLREHGMGSWEGLTRAEVADRFPEQYADWMAGRPVRGRGGEDPSEVAA